MGRPHGRSDLSPGRGRSSRPARPVGRAARPLAAAAVAVALLTGLASCGSSGSGSKNSSGTASGPLSTKAVVAKVRGATVAVVQQPRGEKNAPAKGGAHAHGSGVVYDARNGLVLTSDHLVEHGVVRVTPDGGAEIDANVVARLQCSDLAVIKVHNASGLNQVTMAKAGSLHNGDAVTAVGWLKPPGAQHPTLNSVAGTASAVGVAKDIGPLPFASVVDVQAPALDKNLSGGALVDDRGELVGLTTVVPGVKAGGIDEAVAGDELRQRLDPKRAGGLKRTAQGGYAGWESDHQKCHHPMQTLYEKALVYHGGSHTSSGHQHSG